jgi:bidirectional [NiFe] hydrogenase diaphorase subunit
MGSVQRKVQSEPESQFHPSGDDRFKMLDASMKRHRYQPDALIEVLHTAQELFGYLKDDILIYVAHGLKLPPSRVYGVATFYHFFTFSPRAAHTCVVCLGTSCYVNGAENLLSLVRDCAAKENLEAGGNGKFVSVEVARCLGACGLAPVAVFDGEVCGTVQPAAALARMKGWREHGPG